MTLHIRTARKALRRLADAYPDPETSTNTAISTALDVKLTQVDIVHPPENAIETASVTN